MMESNTALPPSPVQEAEEPVAPMDDGHAPFYKLDLDSPAAAADRERRYRIALQLLKEWLADESGYDEEIWPQLEKALAENPISFRTVYDE